MKAVIRISGDSWGDLICIAAGSRSPATPSCQSTVSTTCAYKSKKTPLLATTKHVTVFSMRVHTHMHTCITKRSVLKEGIYLKTQAV